MKIIIFGATEIGCLLATEFFEDHDITIIDKEENKTDEFNKLDISFVGGNVCDVSVKPTLSPVLQQKKSEVSVQFVL